MAAEQAAVKGISWRMPLLTMMFPIATFADALKRAGAAVAAGLSTTTDRPRNIAQPYSRMASRRWVADLLLVSIGRADVPCATTTLSTPTSAPAGDAEIHGRSPPSRPERGIRLARHLDIRTTASLRERLFDHRPYASHHPPGPTFAIAHSKPRRTTVSKTIDLSFSIHLGSSIDQQFTHDVFS